MNQNELKNEQLDNVAGGDGISISIGGGSRIPTGPSGELQCPQCEEQKDLRRLARHRFRCNDFETEFAF